jgi:dipeptide transport system substrate-binding protein
VFSINKDPAARLAKLRANECQIMAFPNLADLPAIKADAGLQLMEQPGLNIGYLAFNNQKPPFTDKRVRILPSTWRSTNRRSCRRCIRGLASRRRT